MHFRGAASLADVPYWRKPKNRLTATILPWAGHFLKAIFGHRRILIYLFAISYRDYPGCRTNLSRRCVPLDPRGHFHKNILDICAIRSPTISYTVRPPGYKIKALFTMFRRILIVSYEQILERLSRDDRFKATVYAMNTLLIHKGIYTQKEFQELFVEWASKQGKFSNQEISHEARVSV